MRQLPANVGTETGGEAQQWATTEIKLPDGTAWMTTSPSDTRMLYQEIFTDGVYSEFARGAQDPDSTIIDVGANSGLSALYFSRHCPAASIIAIEPAPVTFSCLALNMLRYVPQADVVQSAVAARRGVTTLTYYPKTPSQSGLYTDAIRDDALTASYLQNIGYDDQSVEFVVAGLHSERIETKVPCGPLDELLAAFEYTEDSSIHLKIDVERSELDVLDSIREFWPAVKTVACEVEDTSGQLAQVLSILANAGIVARAEQQASLEGSPLWFVSGRRPQ